MLDEGLGLLVRLGLGELGLVWFLGELGFGLRERRGWM